MLILNLINTQRQYSQIPQKLIKRMQNFPDPYNIKNSIEIKSELQKYT